MHDVLGGEMTVPEVERNALSQGERPFLVVRAGLPLLSQAGRVLTGLGVHLEQGFQERVVLEMIGATDHPETVAVLEPGGREQELLDLGLLRRSR